MKDKNKRKKKGKSRKASWLHTKNIGSKLKETHKGQSPSHATILTVAFELQKQQPVGEWEDGDGT